MTTETKPAEEATMLTCELRDRWIAALRSGKYKQGQYHLHSGDEYCCLGVLCEVAGIEQRETAPGVFEFRVEGYGSDDPDWTDSRYPKNIAGLSSVWCSRLAAKNDAKKGFAHIAEIIEVGVPCSPPVEEE
jgi:hypothetical protein